MNKLFVVVLLMATGCGQTPPGVPWVRTNDASIFAPSHPVTNCVSPDDPDYQTLPDEWKNKLRCCVAADDPDYQVVTDEWKCPLVNTPDGGTADVSADSGEPQDAPPDIPKDTEATDGGTLQDGSIGEDSGLTEDSGTLPDNGSDANETSTEDSGALQDDGSCEDSGLTEDISGTPPDSGSDDAICTCLCDYPSTQSDGGIGGEGHWMLHCHEGIYCADGNGCYNGYHCHVGHDCALVGDTTNHPECTSGEIIYVPHDTCGNPCECPAYDDPSYGGA